MDRDAALVLKFGMDELILGDMVGLLNMVLEGDSPCSYSHCSSPIGKRLKQGPQMGRASSHYISPSQYIFMIFCNSQHIGLLPWRIETSTQKIQVGCVDGIVSYLDFPPLASLTSQPRFLMSSPLRLCTIR